MSTTDAEHNAEVIDELSADEGRVGGVWEGTPMRLLRHTTAKSGASRVDPVRSLPDEPRYLIFASNGGAPSDLGRYHNLEAQPNRKVEAGSETMDLMAEEATGDERERLFARGAERFPDLAKYARKTDHLISVMVLTPLGGA